MEGLAVVALLGADVGAVARAASRIEKRFGCISDKASHPARSGGRLFFAGKPGYDAMNRGWRSSC
jgi:hypothetical protein